MCDAVALRPATGDGPKGATPRSLLLRAASWRTRPATDKQKEHLKKRVGEGLDGFLRLANGGTAVSIDEIDKGLAGRAMTMLKHGGAKSMLISHEKREDRRIQKVQKRLDKQARDQPVRVGPFGR